MILMALLLVGCPGKGGDETGSDDVQRAFSAEGVSVSHPTWGALDATFEVLGEGTLELAVEPVGSDGAAFRPTLTATNDATFRGLALHGQVSIGGREPLRVWRQGYQSWSWSGVVELETATLDDVGLPEGGGDGDNLSSVDETPTTSWWVGLLGRSDGGGALLGFLSARETRTWVAFSGEGDGPAEVWAVWGNRGESISLPAGASLVLDPLRVDLGSDPFELHRSYAAAAVTDGAPARPLTPPPPTGWATWYTFYDEVTEEDVRSNLARAVALRDVSGLPPLEVFQVDDGWARAWGDWTANERFPSGMAVLAADIAAQGFVPGLWMAPFYVSRSTSTWQEHPDWWVREADGEEIAFSNLGTDDYAVLDVTHPDAAAWLQEVVAARVAEGWTYLKLDFLYAGAQEGVRQEALTGSQAYARGLDLLRDAAPDAWILACGAPLLPSVGFAESFRTGSDIAFGNDPDPRLEYLRWQARATAARSWTNGLWWWMDADQILVRSPFDDAQARGSVTANAVSGGVWFLGDDLPSLPDPRVAMALQPEVVATRGTVGRPVDPLAWPSGLDLGPAVEFYLPDDRVPVQWTLDSGHSAVLNLTEDPVEVPCPAGARGLLSGSPCPSTASISLASGEGEVFDG